MAAFRAAERVKNLPVIQPEICSTRGQARPEIVETGRASLAAMG